MTRRARPSSLCLAMAAATLLVGCASGGLSRLHWHGGDVFGVTADDSGTPSRLDCPGTTEQRFSCFAETWRGRAADTSSVYAVAVQDESVLHAMTTEPGQVTPTSLDTLFPLASLTKMFTAATAARLVQEGLLDPQRPISAYLPELGAESELGRSTVHQLLTHTAGVLDSADQPLCVGAGDLPAVVGHTHIAAAPGSVFLYSNTGYALVGVIIERVTGHRFEDVVREKVLEPMGMTTATFDGSALQVRGHAASSTPSRCRAMYPAGGLVASTRDLTRWARAMTNPDSHPLGRGVVDVLTASYVPTGERPGETYGYGVSALTHGGVRVYNHGGNLDDFGAFVAWSPEREFASAAVTNAPRGAPAVAVLRGLSLLLDLPEDWRPSAAGGRRPDTAFVGTYVDRRSTLGRVRVRVDGEQLVYDYLDQRPPLLPTTFRFQFEPGEEQAKYLVTTVGVAERIANP